MFMIHYLFPFITFTPIYMGPIVEHVHDTQTIVSLISLLSDESPDVRREVTWALWHLGPQAVPELANALRDENRFVRIGSANALGRIGPDAYPATTALAQAMQENDKDVRLAMINALGRIGYDAREAIVALVHLGDHDQDVQQTTRTALRRIGGTVEYIPHLVGELANQDEDVRAAAAYALGLIGPNAGAAVDALVTAIHDSSKEVQLAAIRALSDVGPIADSAVVALVRLQENDPDVHAAVRGALISIGAQPTLLPSLVEELDDPRDDVRARAAHVLGRMGPNGVGAVDPLIVAARRGNETARVEAARALRKILP